MDNKYDADRILLTLSNSNGRFLLISHTHVEKITQSQQSYHSGFEIYPIFHWFIHILVDFRLKLSTIHPSISKKNVKSSLVMSTGDVSLETSAKMIILSKDAEKDTNWISPEYFWWTSHYYLLHVRKIKIRIMATYNGVTMGHCSTSWTLCIGWRFVLLISWPMESARPTNLTTEKWRISNSSMPRRIAVVHRGGCDCCIEKSVFCRLILYMKAY